MLKKSNFLPSHIPPTKPNHLLLLEMLNPVKPKKQEPSPNVRPFPGNDVRSNP